MDPYLLLAAVEGCGPAMVPQLLDPCDDPEHLLRSPPELPPAARRRLSDPTTRAVAHQWQQDAKERGMAVLTPASDGYPERLRHGPLRPLVLFVRGSAAALSASGSLTVVGSRTPTPYGLAAATDFCAALARSGLVLWSGLAYGVDGVAHRACVDADRPTVAVLAGGLDRIYPRTHEPLAERILRTGGALVSETPPGRRPSRGLFPRRNRILGMASRGVLVIEAGLLSGTLHTAHHAGEAGTPVFAVPGPYTSPRSRGCHQLILEGATLACDPEDLLRELDVAAVREDPAHLHVTADECAVVRVLQGGPRPADLVQREARLPRDAYLRAVMGLTTRGVVRALPGDLLALAGHTPHSIGSRG